MTKLNRKFVMSQHDELMQQIQESMPTVKRLMQARIHEMLQEYDLSYAQFEILTTLLRAEPTAPSSRELGEQLHITAGAVSQLLSSLLALEYVSRVEDTQDRRISRISLSVNGRKVIKKIHTNKHLLMRGALEHMSDQELQTMLSVQLKIIEHLQSK